MLEVADYIFNRFWNDYKRGLYDVVHMKYYLPSFSIRRQGNDKYLHGIYYQHYNRSPREVCAPLNSPIYRRNSNSSLYYSRYPTITIRINGRHIPFVCNIDALDAVCVRLDEPVILFSFVFKTFLMLYSDFFLRVGEPVRHEQYASYMGVLVAFKHADTELCSRAEIAGLAYLLGYQAVLYPDFICAHKLMCIEAGGSYNFCRALDSGIIPGMLHSEGLSIFFPGPRTVVFENTDPREVFLRKAFFAFSDVVSHSCSSRLKRAHFDAINDYTFEKFDALLVRGTE